jgi:hypothetical protein
MAPFGTRVFPIAVIPAEAGIQVWPTPFGKVCGRGLPPFGKLMASFARE